MILPVPVAQNQFKHVPRQTLQTSRCFGCVSGSFGRGSESPSTHKRKRDAMWKCQRVLHANQRLRKAKQWSMSRDVNFLGRNLDSTKSCLIGNHCTEVLLDVGCQLLDHITSGHRPGSASPVFPMSRRDGQENEIK